MAAEAGAEMTMMENRFVPARFKDGYGPVGAWFLLFKAKVMNGMGEDYNALRGDVIRTRSASASTARACRAPACGITSS